MAGPVSASGKKLVRQLVGQEGLESVGIVDADALEGIEVISNVSGGGSVGAKTISARISLRLVISGTGRSKNAAVRATLRPISASVIASRSKNRH